MGQTVNVPFNQHVFQHLYLAVLTSLIPDDFIYGNLRAAPKYVATEVLAKCIGHL